MISGEHGFMSTAVCREAKKKGPRRAPSHVLARHAAGPTDPAPTDPVERLPLRLLEQTVAAVVAAVQHVHQA